MRKYRAIISWMDVLQRERISLQRGMNFRVNPKYSIFLMSVRKGAPYKDKWHEDTGLLEYEGHDVRRTKGVEPKTVDQPMRNPSGSLTENGKFYEAAQAYKTHEQPPEIVQVYEKIKEGIWSDRGRYELVDAAIKSDAKRKVFRFFLKPCPTPGGSKSQPILRRTRQIPMEVKVTVWKRDSGRCVVCGSDKNLHFDHDIPYSKGGSSITAENVRLLCARHNLEKSNKIMSLAPWVIGVGTAIVSRTA